MRRRACPRRRSTRVQTTRLCRASRDDPRETARFRTAFVCAAWTLCRADHGRGASSSRGWGVRLATGIRWRMMTGRFPIRFHPAVRSENVREPVTGRPNAAQVSDRRQVVDRRRKTNTIPEAESEPVTRVSVSTVALTETRLRQTPETCTRTRRVNHACWTETLQERCVCVLVRSP